jgi:[CysO sulfur-carrier protein]-S-L-cysteine hydrolase
VLISSALLDELLAHAREEAPNECCGVIFAEPGPPLRAVRVHRAVNIAASPLRFEVDPKELLRVNDEAEETASRLAIYHSHTRTAPYPSQTDINFAAGWPGVEWVIVGLADGDQPAVRSYVIENGEVREVALRESDQ